jgi:hypothetical protein
MLKNENESTYDVGYGQPPKHTRFRQGASGNPRGRPKGKRNLATVLERALQEKITITENGVCKTVTKLEAAMKQLVNKAISGDLGALRQLTAFVGSAEDQAVDPPTKQLPDADLKVMQGVLKRLEGCANGEDGED